MIITTALVLAVLAAVLFAVTHFLDTATKVAVRITLLVLGCFIAAAVAYMSAPKDDLPAVAEAPASQNPTTTDPSPPPTAASTPPHTDAGPTSQPDPSGNSAFASVSGQTGPYGYRTIFGRYQQLRDVLGDSVTFNVASEPAATECALTTVFTGVAGNTAAVWAMVDAYGNWKPVEDAPNQDPAADAGVVHNELIAPPLGASPGDTLDGYGHLIINDDEEHPYNTDKYNLTLVSSTDSLQEWNFNGETVRCSSWKAM